jgi:hypothetical protein
MSLRNVGSKSHGVTSKKTAFFIVTIVKTKNLRYRHFCILGFARSNIITKAKHDIEKNCVHYSGTQTLLDRQTRCLSTGEPVRNTW